MFGGGMAAPFLKGGKYGEKVKICKLLQGSFKGNEAEEIHAEVRFGKTSGPEESGVCDECAGG